MACVPVHEKIKQTLACHEGSHKGDTRNGERSKEKCRTGQILAGAGQDDGVEMSCLDKLQLKHVQQEVLLVEVAHSGQSGEALQAADPTS